MWKWIRRRSLLLGLVLVSAVGLYAAAGFWAVPKLARTQATDYVRTELGKSLSLGEIRFNPFTFRAEIADMAIREPGNGAGQPLVAWRRLAADFQVSSLWEGAYTFREISLEAPYAQAIIRPDGSLNLGDLLPKSQDDGPPPALWIQRFAVAQGHLDFADQSRRLTPTKRFSPIKFELRDFRTVASGGGFLLQAKGDEGESLDWQGSLSLQPFASDGKLKIQGLQARNVYEFLSEQLPMELSAGHFDLAGSYRFSVPAKAGMQLEVQLSEASATALALRGKGLKTDWVTLPLAALDNTRVSLTKQEIAIDAMRISGMKTSVWRQSDGSLNLQQLFPPDGTGESDETAADSEWKFNLAQLVLDNADLDFEDKAVKPAARFRLNPLSLTASGISLDMDRPVPMTIQAAINNGARLSVHGELIPATAAAVLQVDLSALPLRDVLGYLPDFPRLELRSGNLDAKGELKLPPTDAAASLSFSGDASLDSFKLMERAEQRELMSWQRVDVYGVDYRQTPASISIRRMHARKPFAIVTVEQDRTLNLANVFADPASPVAPPTAAQAAAPPPTARPVRTAEQTAAPAMTVKVGELRLDGGTMAFADYSIDPNFRAHIESLAGTIRGLSTATDSVADIDLTGHILNRYTPVTIRGGTNVFAFDKHTDIAMTFRNIDLPIFNPYSGRFAGYAIAKGKLTTELHYQIDDRQLKAAHHVLLDQLEWGEATDSQDKVSLPIRLATSLLKDRHGVIDLDLPVTGSLDDPTFRVWPVVWQILKNLLVKIVTAPFAFIGSLFQGAEDAQYVSFVPGSADLSEAARGNLAALAKGLADRPTLRLDIPAGIAADADPTAIAEQRMLRAAADLQKTDSAAFAALPADEQIEALEKLFRQQLGKKPDIPDADANADEATRKEKRGLREQAALAWLRTQLLAHYQPTPTELEELGRARASAIQDALLAGGALDPTRVFITAAKAPSLHEGSVRLELALE
ncbi:MULTISPECIES: DUF748 domain-containing protein [unclassified Pseudoxanthomonas]|uniref:DUF748 domain-containing protein n=1 Tax=unclassified Pseudoxanthomonas TaxID=2645906 RepID=UPI0030774687